MRRAILPLVLSILVLRPAASPASVDSGAPDVSESRIGGGQESPPPPGCGLRAPLDACLEESGNGAEMRVCYDAALAGAEAELERQLDRIRRTEADRSQLLAALDEAQIAWIAFVEADCEVVSRDWEGGAMRGAKILACRFEHTLRRSQELWNRHLGAADRTPDPCSAEPANTLSER